MRLLTIVRHRLKTGAPATPVTALYNYIFHPVKFHEAGFSTQKMIKSAEIFHCANIIKVALNKHRKWVVPTTRQVIGI